MSVAMLTKRVFGAADIVMFECLLRLERPVAADSAVHSWGGGFVLL